jgi:hypothetical protein
MQVDGCDLEIPMAQQYLNSAPVSAGFKKMCGEDDTDLLTACAILGVVIEQ